jgi:ribosome-binding factor A
MQGRRIDRIEEQLRIELSEVLEREVQDPRVRLVTVTRVKASPDLSHARVFVSALQKEDDRKKILQGLRSAAGYVKRSLGQRLHHLKRIPDLTFEFDDTLDRETRIEQLLDQIKTEPE